VEKFDLQLLLPLRRVGSGKDIEAIVGHLWEKDTEQLECVMSRNYLEKDGGVIYSEDEIKSFLNEFAIRKAEGEIKRFFTAIKQ